MKRILFYAPFNARSRDNETLMLAFKEEGYEVYFLTQLAGDEIIQVLNSKGIHAVSKPSKYSNNIISTVYHLLQLIKFCAQFKIDILFSHLEPANFIASLGQYFMKAKVFIVRHHINEANLYGFDKSFSYKITYWLAKRIIVVSDHAKKYMILNEGIDSKKIQHINLAYDFSLYNKADTSTAANIRESLNTDVILICICRFTKFKRPELSILTLQKLIQDKIDAKLILLGKGEMQTELKELIDQLRLNNKVIMPGHVNNVLDYINASDFLIHPSLLDSSCVVVKEAGLEEKPVIVCKGIGDFDEYIIHEENGLKTSVNNFVEEAVGYIRKYQSNDLQKKQMGKNLHNSVIRLFDIKVILPQYLEVLEEN